MDKNLVDELWEIEGKEESIKQPVMIHPLEYSGETSESKVHRIQETMREKQIDYLIISALDEIAWLFNVI